VHQVLLLLLLDSVLYDSVRLILLQNPILKKKSLNVFFLEYVICQNVPKLYSSSMAVVLTILHSRKHSHHQGLPVPGPPGAISQKYAQALKVALTFFPIEKAGKLPNDNPIPWRENSALSYGNDVGADLS